MSASEDATISEVDLFLLPAEVQEVVLDHLDVKDLVSCSKVCRLWRAGINVSYIWKKWCQVESYDPTLMETHGEDHIEDEEFTNMGWWRKVYCWHAKLEMNWRRRLCKNFKLVDTDSTDNIVSCFAADGTVAVTGHQNASVVVWSMKTPPALIGRVQGVLHSSPISFVRVHGNLLVVAQGRLIEVFQKVDDNYELTDLKCFEMGVADVDQMENFTNQENEYSSWYLTWLRENDRVTSIGPRGSDVIFFEVHQSSLYVSFPFSETVWAWTLPRSEVCSVRVHGCRVNQILKDQDAVYFVMTDYVNKNFVTNSIVTNFMKYEVGSEAPSVLFSVPDYSHMIIGDELVLAHPLCGDFPTDGTLWVYKKGDYSQPIGTRNLSGCLVFAITHPNLVVYYEYHTEHVTVWDPVSNANCARFTPNATIY